MVVDDPIRSPSLEFLGLSHCAGSFLNNSFDEDVVPKVSVDSYAIVR